MQYSVHSDANRELRVMEGTAAESGYRMPAEWEPQSCVWVVRPHNEETWPRCLDEARRQFDDWINAMSRAVPVSLAGPLGIDTNDSWIRDFGPIFVVKDGDFTSPDRLACHDFRFNGWGNKYEVRDLDDHVPRQIAARLNIPIWLHDFVLEGGAVEVNGGGTIMTTEQCLLNANRNPGKSREQIERKLYETLGTSHIIWLAGGITGDDTDGHIDDVARFISPDTVVVVVTETDHPDHEITNRNLQVLRGSTDEQGRRLTVIDLPAPDPLEYNYPPDRFGSGGLSTLPASYANFVISNRHVFLPVFACRQDETAVRIMEQAMPDHTIIPLRAEHLIVGLGSFHCLSRQQPM